MANKNKAQVSLEFLIILAAAIAALVAIMSAVTPMSNKALERSELQTQQAAFNQIMLNANSINSITTGSGYELKVNLIEKANVTLRDGLILMTFTVQNKTLQWSGKISNQITANLELKQGDNTLIFQKEADGVKVYLK